MRWYETASIVAVLALVGCTADSRSPEAIRHDTANVTQTAAKDAKAVVLGVTDGLRHHKGPLDLNSADSSNLQTLPGITPDVADRIVSNRPYKTPSDLVRRHLVTRGEYDGIRDKVVVDSNH